MIVINELLTRIKDKDIWTSFEIQEMVRKIVEDLNKVCTASDTTTTESHPATHPHPDPDHPTIIDTTPWTPTPYAHHNGPTMM